MKTAWKARGKHLSKSLTPGLCSTAGPQNARNVCPSNGLRLGFFYYLFILSALSLISALEFELGLKLARQVLYHLNHFASPFCFIFQVGSLDFLPEVSLRLQSSHITEITDMHYHA
jgi:hypothetical protein